MPRAGVMSRSSAGTTIVALCLVRSVIGFIGLSDARADATHDAALGRSAAVLVEVVPCCAGAAAEAVAPPLAALVLARGDGFEVSYAVTTTAYVVEHVTGGDWTVLDLVHRDVSELVVGGGAVAVAIVTADPETAAVDRVPLGQIE